MDDSEFNRKSTEFLAWLKQQDGVSINPKLELADFRSRGAGRGVIALKNIEEGEELFTIPHTAVLRVSNSDLYKRIPDKLNELTPWLSLVLVMVYEFGKGKASKWWPYFEILPKELDTLAYWSSDELAELQGSAVLSKIGKEEANGAFIRHLWPIVKEGNRSLFPGFRYSIVSEVFLPLAHRMASLIMAYAFDIDPAETDRNAQSPDEEEYVSDNEEDYPKGMVPLADMLNADADRNNARLIQDDTSLTMTAIKNIEKGEEIFNDYGALPRSDLLRRYGYITDGYKQWDVVEIDMQKVMECVPEVTGHKLSTVKHRFAYARHHKDLEKTFDIGRRSGKRHHHHDGFDKDMLSFVDILVMSQDQFNGRCLHRVQKRTAPFVVRSYESEISKVLQKALANRLKEYMTTTTEDRALLQDPSLPRRRRMAIEVRLGEKEILEEAEHHMHYDFYPPHPNSDDDDDDNSDLTLSEIEEDQGHGDRQLAKKRRRSDGSEHDEKRRKG